MSPFRTITLWRFFAVVIVVSIVHFVGLLFDIEILKSIFFESLAIYIPFILVLFHAAWTLAFYRGIFLVLLGSIVGYISEFYSLRYGYLLNFEYIYHSDGLFIGSVPLEIIAFWGIFIYLGYSVSNSFLYWLKKKKPSLKKNFYLLPLLILADVIVIVSIDLFMDPLWVLLGNWKWMTKGAYFGIPLGNFALWVIVVAATSGCYRIYEFFKPIKKNLRQSSATLIPIISYGFLYLLFLSLAIKFGMFTLALVGSLTMLPIVGMNLFLFSNFLGKRRISDYW